MIDYNYTAAAWIEAFTIFQKYLGDNECHVEPGHDQVWAGPDTTLVSLEDAQRLNELGWLTDEDGFFRFT